jgi:hypothetical protein
MGLWMMLRIHFLQQSFNLSEPAAEEALYDSLVLRRFAGVDLGRARRRPTRRRSASSVICWRSTIWAVPCWMR